MAVSIDTPKSQMECYGLPAGLVCLPQGAGVQKLGATAWEKQVKHKLAWCSIYVSLCFLSILSTIFTLSKVHLLQTAQYN